MPITNQAPTHGRPMTLHYDVLGVPGIVAQNQEDAYFGLGQVHGRHFQQQAGCLWTAAEGKLSERIAPTKTHGQIDRWVQRCQLFTIAQQQVGQLEPVTATYLHAYIQGYRSSAEQRCLRNTWHKPWCWLTNRAANTHPTLAHLLAATALSGLLNGCKYHAEMKMLLLGLLQAGAEPDLLASWFGQSWPQNWTEREWQASKHWPLASDLSFDFAPFQPATTTWWQKLAQWWQPRRPAAVGATAGGSNAWALLDNDGHQLRALLAGDPHLPIDQLPSTLHPIRASIGKQAYWLGFAMPGLPMLAIGRNQALAWSCTNAVGDTMHWSWTSAAERTQSGQLHLGQLQRRWHTQAESFPYWVGPAGQIAWPGVGANQQDWPTCYWPAGRADFASTLSHWMALSHSTSVLAAQVHLAHVASRSLHVICIDRKQQIGAMQVGRPMQGHHSPAPLWLAPAPLTWQQLRPVTFSPTWRRLGRAQQQRALIVSANQGWPNQRQQDVTPLAQPHYRAHAISEALWTMAEPSLRQFAALQQHLHCPQAARLLPLILDEGALPAGAWRSALELWDGTMESHSQGARCFSQLLQALYGAFATKLGGELWHLAHERTAATVWLAKHLDNHLSQSAHWQGELGPAWRQALAKCCEQALPPPTHYWPMKMQGMGELFSWLHPALKRLPLRGSLATVAQGNRVPNGSSFDIIGPAARILADMGQDALWVAWPGGTDACPYHPGFASMLPQWQQGRYHVLSPPTPQESAKPPRWPRIQSDSHMAPVVPAVGDPTKQA